MGIKQNVLSVDLSGKISPSSAKRGFSFYEKLAFLYLLNLIDWLCTEALLLSGRFYEANPLMSGLITGFWPAFIIKAVLPLGMIIICSVIYRLSGGVESLAADIIIYIGIAIYALVNLWHIFNFVLLFFVF